MGLGKSVSISFLQCPSDSVEVTRPKGGERASHFLRNESNEMF